MILPLGFIHSLWEFLGMGIWAPLLFGYFPGSIPFGYLIAKFAYGSNIQKMGSGNIGAANVSRQLGRSAGVLTLILDAAKGFFAVSFVSWIVPSPFETDVSIQIWAGIGAMLGHFFPVWLKFKGGKGVATGVGVFLPICWPAVAGALLVWVAVLYTFHYVSLASMLASASLPILIYFLYDVPPGYAPPLVVTLGAVAAAIMIILKHHENIARLAAGVEPKSGKKHRGQK